MNYQSKSLLLVLSSPSGAGKTTLSKKIQQSDNSFKISEDQIRLWKVKRDVSQQEWKVKRNGN